jgi:Uma2 family endonuclease
VLSPGQPAGRFAAKVNFYLRHGVRLVWIVDPDRREVVVLSAADEARTLRPGDTLAGGDVLPGFAVPVADIFAELDVQAPPPQA